MASLARLEQIIELAPNIELEIGCGSGTFLAAHCLTKRDVLVIGCETKIDRCRKAARKLKTARAGNGIIVRGRAEEAIAWLSTESLNAVHIYFPDPWPKPRHRKRRLLKKPILNQLSQCLRPSGHLYLITDFFDYYLQVLTLLLLDTSLKVNRDPTRVPAYSEPELSRYGPRLMALGKTIHCLAAEKIQS